MQRKHNFLLEVLDSQLKIKLPLSLTAGREGNRMGEGWEESARERA